MSPAAEIEVIAQLTDPHIRSGTNDQAAIADLQRAVAQVGELEPAPVAVLLTGDLAHSGSAQEYARVRELLEPLAMPVHPIPGNHDDRDELRAAFSDHDGIGGAGERVAYEAQSGSVRVLCCDTLDPSRGDGGSLGADQIGWLDERLSAGSGPVIVAMHHPPILTGMPRFDELGLPDGERAALAAVLAGNDEIERVLAGHIHRTFTGRLGGRSVFVSQSVHLQARLDIGADVDIELAPDPPGFALHVWGADPALLSHAVSTAESR